MGTRALSFEHSPRSDTSDTAVVAPAAPAQPLPWWAAWQARLFGAPAGERGEPSTLPAEGAADDPMSAGIARLRKASREFAGALAPPKLGSFALATDADGAAAASDAAGAPAAAAAAAAAAAPAPSGGPSGSAAAPEEPAYPAWYLALEADPNEGAAPVEELISQLKKEAALLKQQAPRHAPPTHQLCQGRRTRTRPRPRAASPPTCTCTLTPVL